MDCIKQLNMLSEEVASMRRELSMLKNLAEEMEPEFQLTAGEKRCMEVISNAGFLEKIVDGAVCVATVVNNSPTKNHEHTYTKEEMMNAINIIFQESFDSMGVDENWEIFLLDIS